MNNRRFVLCVVAWMALVFYHAVIILMSTRSHLPVNLEYGIDKIIHFFEFGILGVLAARAWALTIPSSQLPVILCGVMYVCIAASADEYIQGFVPGREQSLLDLIFDIAGGSAGIAGYGYIGNYLRGKTVSCSNTQ